jgi:hypothetical protein
MASSARSRDANTPIEVSMNPPGKLLAIDRAESIKTAFRRWAFPLVAGWRASAAGPFVGKFAFNVKFCQEN